MKLHNSRVLNKSSVKAVKTAKNEFFITHALFQPFFVPIKRG